MQILALPSMSEHIASSSSLYLQQTASPIIIQFESMSQQDQSQQPCVMCHEPNEQMLMLSCVHDPCVNCAAVHYVENQPHNSPIYTCGKCGQETELDQSSLNELRRVYNGLKKKYRGQVSSFSNKRKSQGRDFQPYQNTDNKAYAKKRVNEPLTQSRAKDFEQTPPQTKYYPSAPVSQPSYSSGATKKAAHQIMYPCPDHQEQQLTYFCFSCNRPICPQCAIHGLHKDHEVQTTRKAIKQIKQLLLEDRQKLDEEMGELAATRDRAKKISKEWTDQHKKDQDYIRRKLNQLKAAITQKEKELLRSTEANLQKNCDIMKNQAFASDKSLDNIAAVKRAIDNTLKKQDLAVLQEFNKRDEQANQATQLADIERQKLREQQLKNPLKALDIELFEEDVDRLIGDVKILKLSTNAPKS